MDKHHKLILGTLRTLDNTIRSVEYVVNRSAGEPRREPRREPQQNASLDLGTPTSVEHRPKGTTAPVPRPLPGGA